MVTTSERAAELDAQKERCGKEGKGEARRGQAPPRRGPRVPRTEHFPGSGGASGKYFAIRVGTQRWEERRAVRLLLWLVTPPAVTECPCSRHCTKLLQRLRVIETARRPYNPQCTGGKESSERSSNLPEVAQPLSGRLRRASRFFVCLWCCCAGGTACVSPTGWASAPSWPPV